MNYSWNIDGTQADDLQVTIMIHDDDTDKLSSNYIGEFTMFFKDEDEIWEFLERGQSEWRLYHSVIEKIRGLATTTRNEE